MMDASQTIEYYNIHHQEFTSGTLDVPFSDIQDRFLRLLPKGALILDFGCGTGRDSRYFLQKGYRVEACDGSAEMVRTAEEVAGIPVRQMLFQELDAMDLYDGIWACASILHLPKRELIDAVHRIAAALKPGGILYTSFKYGNFEGIRGGRHFTDFTKESLTKFWAEFPALKITELWITQDVRPGREEERWINLLARRV